MQGGRVVPETGAFVGGSNVGANIVDPPVEVIEPPADVYHQQIVNKRHDYGLFETELKSMGYFERDGVTYFRLDIWAHNVGDNAETFMWEKATIQKIPTLYKVSSTNVEWADIPHDGEVEGYLLFEDIPTDLEGQIIVVIGHTVGYSSILGFTSQAPHKFVLDLF